jgi:hypothetical protein
MFMRRTNWRVVIVGSVLALLAVGFFFYMWGIAPQSNDPKAMMQTVGEASGVVVGIGLVMAVLGLIGRKA